MKEDNEYVKSLIKEVYYYKNSIGNKRNLKVTPENESLNVSMIKDKNMDEWMVPMSERKYNKVKKLVEPLEQVLKKIRQCQ